MFIFHVIIFFSKGNLSEVDFFFHSNCPLLCYPCHHLSASVKYISSQIGFSNFLPSDSIF